jgi:tight adherence protein B
VIDTPAFIPGCIVVGVMLVINVIFMKVMINIKV